MPEYIVRMSDNGIDIVGPFSDEGYLCEWGRANQEARNDDPRWQSIMLDIPFTLEVLPIRVYTPLSAPDGVKDMNVKIDSENWNRLVQERYPHLFGEKPEPVKVPWYNREVKYGYYYVAAGWAVSALLIWLAYRHG